VAPAKLRFAWPVPGRVAVTHRAEKGGHVTTMRYDLAVTRNAAGMLEVRFAHFIFLDFDGKDLRSPPYGKVVEDLAKLAAMIPTMLVSPEGEYAGVSGMDEMVEAILAHENTPGKDPAAIAAAARLLRSPEMKARLTERTGDYWMTWVGLWKDLRLVPGQTWETTMDGASAVYHHHGPVPGERGLVRFSAIIVLEGEPARAQLADVLGEVTRQLGVTDLPPVERMRREVRASADTDPLTLRPRRARLETILDVKVQGIPATSKREVNDYELDW
jgi:hypothetical protein